MNNENKMKVILNKRKKLNLNDDYGIISTFEILNDFAYRKL